MPDGLAKSVRSTGTAAGQPIRPMLVPFPFAFLADMYYWLRYAGQNLDPTAALSGAVKPFTPTLLGHGVVGQFSTDAMVQTGFWIAAAAALLSLAGLVGRLRSGKAG